MEVQAEYQVTKPERSALAEFAVTPAKVAEMAKEYMALTVPPEDTKAYKVARSALTVCVTTRTGTDKRRKELGEDARKWVSDCNAAAKELIAPLAPAEEHLRLVLQTEDDRKEAIRAEKARIERERIEAHKKGIDYIRTFSIVSPALTADYISSSLKTLSDIDTSEADFEEFWTEASRVKAETLKYVNKALETRLQWEKDEEERKAESERLARVSAEQEAERKRLAEIGQELEREIEEKREHFEKIHQDIEAEIVAQREAFEKEQAKFAAEKQAELDRKAAAEEAEQVAQAEAAPQELLKPDKEKLLAFAVQLKIVLSNSPRLANLGDEEARIILQNALTAINDAINGIEEYTA